MEYPDRLLPKPNFKYIESSQICKRNIFLIRHTSTKEVLHPSTGLINIIDPNQSRINLINLSVNLLGIFQLEDVFLEIPDREKRT